MPGCRAGGGRGGTNCCDGDDCDAVEAVELVCDLMGASILVGLSIERWVKEMAVLGCARLDKRRGEFGSF